MALFFYIHTNHAVFVFNSGMGQLLNRKEPFMDLNKGNIKKILGIITFAVLLFVGLEHFTPVSQFFISIFRLVFPFILGGCIAFILNVPMRAIEKTFFTPDFGKRVKAFFHYMANKLKGIRKGAQPVTMAAPVPKKEDEKADGDEDGGKRRISFKNDAEGSADKAQDAGTNSVSSPTVKAKKVKEDLSVRHKLSHYPKRPPLTKGERILDRIKRPCSLIITLILVLGGLFAAVFLVVPEIGHSFEVIGQSIPGFITRVSDWINGLMLAYPDIADQIMSFQLDWQEIGTNLLKFVQNSGGDFVSSTIGVASSIIGGMFNFVLGLIFALYVLLQKERLARQVKQVFYAFLPHKFVEKFLYVCSLAGTTFSKFLSGQCLEACILGFMFFICMTILKFPYALLISVLIAITALIPIFGTFISLFIGAFLILIESPIQAFWFIVLFLILQQVEGNLIYPHVVGGSVGLPSIWVLVAVTVGGSMMGIAGMLIFIPLCSVIYVLVRTEVYKRLIKKKVPSAKWKKQS